jgi:hypothetical protein
MGRKERCSLLSSESQLPAWTVAQCQTANLSAIPLAFLLLVPSLVLIPCCRARAGSPPKGETTSCNACENQQHASDLIFISLRFQFLDSYYTALCHSLPATARLPLNKLKLN